MVERTIEIPPVSYGILEPGLQAAIHLLEQEIRNELSAGEIAAASDDTIAAAQTHAVNVMGYQKAVDLLLEQMERLRTMAPVESYTIKTVHGHVDPDAAA